MKTIYLIILLLFGLVSCSYETVKEKQESLPDFDNIHVERIAGDSLSTNFIIWVKDTVKTHKHEHHSETVYIIDGEAEMYLGEDSFSIMTGDIIFIPKNTWHAVKVRSKNPLKVLSVQAPGFYGKDRVFLNEESNY